MLFLALSMVIVIINPLCRGVDHLYFQEKQSGLSSHVHFRLEGEKPTGAPDGPLSSAQCPQSNDLLSG